LKECFEKETNSYEFVTENNRNGKRGDCCLWIG